MHRKIWFVLIFLPFLLGTMASVLAQWLWSPVPLVAFKIDVEMVAFVTGVFLTLILGTAYLGG